MIYIINIASIINAFAKTTDKMYYFILLLNIKSNAIYYIEPP